MAVHALEVWRRLPLRIILIALVALATLHYCFLDDSDRNVTRVAGANSPQGSAENQAVLPGTSNQDDDEYVAICMSIKDQSLDLPEFLKHHYYNIGIRRFYIMDDGSTPPLSSVSDYGIPNSALTFHYYNASDRVGMMQLNIYNQCNEWYGRFHTWIGYLDADEFVEVADNESLHSMLQTFEQEENIGALGVNWRMHTSSKLITRPESVRKSFTTCIYDDEEKNGDDSDNKLVKSFVRTSKYVRAFNPHTFVLTDGAYMVGESGDVVGHWAYRQPITRQRIAVHHYALKSREEFEFKVNRGNGMGDPKGWDFWDRIEGMPHVYCPEMARYNP